MKVKINFDEAQKLTWKELKCLYGLIKIITPNHISELLKMQLESRSRNVYTKGTRSGFFSTHAVTTQWSFIVLFLVGSVTCSPHIDRSGQESPTTIFFSSSNISVRTRGSLEQKQKYQSGQYKMQTADQVQNADCRLRSLYCFQPFFPILITTKAQVFLSHNCPKIRGNLFHKSWKLT